MVLIAGMILQLIWIYLSGQHNLMFLGLVTVEIIFLSLKQRKIFHEGEYVFVALLTFCFPLFFEGFSLINFMNAIVNASTVFVISYSGYIPFFPLLKIYRRIRKSEYARITYRSVLLEDVLMCYEFTGIEMKWLLGKMNQNSDFILFEMNDHYFDGERLESVYYTYIRVQ